MGIFQKRATAWALWSTSCRTQCINCRSDRPTYQQYVYYLEECLFGSYGHPSLRITSCWPLDARSRTPFIVINCEVKTWIRMSGGFAWSVLFIRTRARTVKSHPMSYTLPRSQRLSSRAAVIDQTFIPTRSPTWYNKQMTSRMLWKRALKRGCTGCNDLKHG